VTNATIRPHYPQESDPLPIVQEAVLATESVRSDTEDVTPSGVRSPDDLPRSESLYLLHYSGRPTTTTTTTTTATTDVSSWQCLQLLTYLHRFVTVVAFCHLIV